MTILKEAVEAVTDRASHYREARDYFEGDVPESFATAKLRKAFKATDDRSRLNFCRTIVTAVANRLEVGSISGDTKVATKVIDDTWKANDLGYESEDVHEKALEFGDYYAVVWPDSSGETTISFHSPLTTALVYDPENPRKKLYGVHMWRASENEHRLNIYTATEIRKYKAFAHDVTGGTQWTATESVSNPWNEVPVFHFRTHRPMGRPEHYDAYDCQNAINKLFVTNMFTIDYHGAPTRYALSNVPEGSIADFDEDDTERENIGALKNGPGELWYLKGVTNVGEFKAADSDAFWKPIMNIVRSMASLTDTPVHYFERAVNPTGNGLRAAEAPLLKKVADRQRAFGYTWREIFKFVLKIEDINSDVVVYWKTQESLDELERWDVALKKINSGLSHRQALREGGYTDLEIEKIMQERAEEAQAGLYYQRAPQTRVNNSHDETAALQQEGDTANE